MTLIWAIYLQNFYMTTFLANTFEQVYLTALYISIADMVAYITSGIIIEKIDTKMAFFLSFTLATIGGLLILVYGLAH